MKLYQSSRLYIKMDGKFRWLTTPEVAEKVMGVGWEKEVREYVDDQDVFNNLGKPIAEWPEVEPVVKPRRWAIAGTTMNRPDWYEALGAVGFTHVYSNKACGMDWEVLDDMGIKVIMTVTGESPSDWASFVRENMGKRVCGGYWHDNAGHEPDIEGPNLQLRKDFYRVVRSIDTDKQTHPVMEMMDNTGRRDFINPDGSYVYPGWELAFSDETHDLLLADIYPDAQGVGRMTEKMSNSWNKFIKVYPRKHQLIIQMCAYGDSYWDGYIWTQYNYWRNHFRSLEYKNPYRTPMGVCWYKQEEWMKSEGMMEEMRDVVREVKRSG